MAILPIRLFGDPVLRERSSTVTDFGTGLRRLAEDMTETMRAAHGAGLAAPQVGVLLRMFVYDVGEGPEVVVNPELADPAGEFTYEEGCLSLPGIFVEIIRPNEITCRYQLLDGTPREVRATELLGRVLQHESSHLQGKLFFEDAPRAARKEALRAIRERMASGVTTWVPDPAEHRTREEAAL